MGGGDLLAKDDPAFIIYQAGGYLGTADVDTDIEFWLHMQILYLKNGKN